MRAVPDFLRFAPETVLLMISFRGGATTWRPRPICWIPERSSLRAHTVKTTYVRPRSSAGRSGKPKSLPSVLGYLAPPHAPLIPALLVPAPSAPAPAGAHSSPSGHPRAPARSPRVLPRAPAPVSTHALPACSPAPSHPHSAHALPACSCTTYRRRGDNRHAAPPPKPPVTRIRPRSCQPAKFAGVPVLWTIPVQSFGLPL